MRLVTPVILLCTVGVSLAASDIPVSCKVTSATSNIVMGTLLPLTLTIENITETPIILDTTPDEILRERTEEYGQSTRQQGSQYTVSISQDTRYHGFITISRKLARDGTAFIELSPGDDYVEEFTIPTQLKVYLASGPLIPGPATVTVRAQIIIGTNTFHIQCSTDTIMLLGENEKMHNQTMEPTGDTRASDLD